jgi:uncharacterized protein YbjT (DUF2867 family)
MADSQSVVMIGATGAVGGVVVRTLVAMPQLRRLTLLGRRPVAGIAGPAIVQHVVDVFDPAAYAQRLPGHATAICTLGVGRRAGMSRDEFIRIDKTAVLDFATACRDAGVRHFELLGSVGANARSPSFFLRSKGELEDGLRALGFRRLSLFRPSMILTPTNRYGVSQAVVLALWPWLNTVLSGPLRPYRGIALADLGRAIANNICTDRTGVETLYFDDFVALSGGARAGCGATVETARQPTHETK